MARNSQSVAATAAEDKQAANGHTNDRDLNAAAKSGDMVKEEQVPTFEQFETLAGLQDGLCIVRKLENGKYELLNLSSINPGTLGSKAFGQSVRGDKSGGRLKAFEEVEKKWKNVEFGVSQAVGSTKLRLFRFMELPIEMRFRVYDYIMTFDNLLSYGSLVKLALRSTSGLQLRGTCQDIYNETKTIFWRNKFCIADLGKSFKMGLSELLDNLREVTWDWHALKILDPQTLIALGLCKQLKVFHLRVTRSVVFGGDHLFDRRQYTYQDEPLAAKFSRSNGFDELLQLRGLETITVENHDHYKFWVKDKYLSNAELKAFETFLASKLTLPKKPPAIEQRPVKSKTTMTKKEKHRKT